VEDSQNDHSLSFREKIDTIGKLVKKCPAHLVSDDGELARVVFNPPEDESQLIEKAAA
jgi:hypothetical protein